MRIRVRGGGLELTDALRDHVERRLLFALGRFGRRVAAVSVRIEDVNGPRGGADKRCLMAVRLNPRGEVVVEKTDSDLYAAVDRAAGRLGEGVARDLARWRPPFRTSGSLGTRGRP